MAKDKPYAYTNLVLRDDKVQVAYNLFREMFWSKSDTDLRELFSLIEARNIVFWINCDENDADLRIKIYADSPVKVKDNVVAAEEGFWREFHSRLDEVLTIPLAEQGCVL